MKNLFIEELKKEDASYLVSKWVIDRVPFLFKNKNESYIIWKEKLASLIDVDSRSIVFIGSSSAGFSLNPNKHFKTFGKSSDIDIAIISSYYFDISWHTLRTLGSKRYDLNAIQKISFQQHIDRLIYWGTIATDKLLPIFPFGKNWILAFEIMSKLKPTFGREIKARIYKDFESLRAYNHYNFVQIRAELLT